MSEQTTPSNNYDQMPYPWYSFPATHIGRLAAIGRLFGLPTVAPRQARVLELGCGRGMNLAALAQLFPEAEFLGLDASARQIEQGREMIAAAGLSHVSLRLEEIGPSTGAEDGSFDYIIAHGIYSWVAPEVRQAILKLCREKLRPEGVAYISYNCLPGWRMRGALRDMMLMHTASIPDLPGKVAQGKALIKFLAESCSEDSAYGLYLRQELEMLRKADDSYIAHEFLEPLNEALYFTDFLKETAAAGLQYLGDADPATMVADNLPAAAAKTLKSLNLNLLATEQYMDFVRNRTFRSTLLCHDTAKLERNLDASRLEGMEAVGLVTLKDQAKDKKSAVFVGAGGVELTVTNPVSVSLFAALVGYGRRSVPVSGLLDHVIDECSGLLAGQDPATVRGDLGRLLLQGYLRKMVDLYIGAPGCPTPAPDAARPVTLPVARWQAAHGQKVSSPRLDMLTPDPFINKFIAVCDGTRDRGAIIEALSAAVVAREFQLNENNQPIIEAGRANTIISHLYEGALKNLDQLGLLAPAPGGNGA